MILLGACVFDPQTHALRNGAGERLPLRAQSLKVLECLVAANGAVVGKEALFRAVWPKIAVTDDSLVQCIGEVRLAMGDARHEVLITEHRRGYRLAARPVAPVAADPHAASGRDSLAPPQAPALALPGKPSIVVLPFLNMDEDGDFAHFADGLAEDITTELSRFHSLFVISRHSAFTYKGKNVDVRAVGRELGVRYVLEGSVRHTSKRIRATAQLVDAHSGNHLWAEKYDRELADFFDIQEEITRAIVAAIEPQIRQSHANWARKARPANLDAYGLARRANSQLLDDLTGQGAASRSEGLRLAQEALALDSETGLAWQTVAAARWLHINLDAPPDPSDAIADGLHAAQRALSIDNADHQAHHIMGLLLFLAKQPHEGLSALRHAYAINPNDAYNLCWLGFYEATSGDMSKAMALAQDGLRLSPLDPWRGSCLALTSAVCIAVGDYAQALDWVDESLLLMPDVPPRLTAKAICHVGLGQYDQAHAVFLIVQRLAPKLVESRLAGQWPSSCSPWYNQRIHTFFRIAAGLEDPGKAAALR